MNNSQTMQDKYSHLEVSVLKLSEVKKDNEKDRLDAEFFSKDFINAYQKVQSMEHIYLKECLEILTDYHANGSYEILNENVKMQDEKDYAYMIRSTDLEKMDFENDVKYISEYAYNFLTKTKVFGGEVLINKIGSPGTTYIVPNLNIPISLGMNLFMIRTNEKTLRNTFLYIFLNTKLGKLIISRKINGAVPQTIDKEAIRTLPIPIFPMPFQLEIEKLVKDSHKALESSKALYKEAETLLYEALGLDSKNPFQSILNTHRKSSLCHCEGMCSTTEKSKSPESKIPKSTHQDISCIRPQYNKASPNYTIATLRESFLKTGRLDAEYYQSKYEKNEALLKSLPHKRLHELVDIYKSVEPGSNFYKEKGLPFVRVSNLSKFGLSQSEVYLDSGDFTKEALQSLYPKKDDVLLSKDGSVGIAYAVENDLKCVLSGAILRLKIKDKTEITPKYLSLVLNGISTQLQAQRDCGGSIIAHWRLEEIQNLLIPLLDSKTQEAIESKISQSFALRAKSKELLESAKQRVENAIHENQ